MDLRSLAQLVPGSHFLTELKAQARCVLPGHQDSDQSLLLRQNGERLTIGCYGGLGHTADALLTALHLTRSDLVVSRPASQTSSAALPPGSPSAALSTNGTTHDATIWNGHVEPPQHRDFGKWQLEVGYQFKGWFGAIPENQRELLASDDDETGLIETLINQAKDSIAAEKRPIWPAPELTETEVDEELRRLATMAVRAFRDDYHLPAVAEQHLPALGEIDRTPIDAYEAAQIMYADRRTYWLGRAGKRGCSIILSGPMGAGKTTFEMNFAYRRGQGEEFLGRPCEQGKTLIVVSPKEFDAWADTIGFWGLREVIYLLRSTQAHFVDGAAAQARWLEKTMKEGRFDVVVLDTLFDFFGMAPNNSGDANRNALAEQTPLLEVINRNSWGLLAGGHTTKADAQAIVPREPEESFAGHTGWAAQHRMRMTIRRKSKGMFALITGRGGYGDEGILEERLLLFDQETRLLTLGGKFSEYLGEAAMPEIEDKLAAGGWFSRSELMQQTGKGKNWVYAGLKAGLKQGKLKWNGLRTNKSKYAQPAEPDEDLDLFGISKSK
jgi:hypothetical protein